MVGRRMHGVGLAAAALVVGVGLAGCSMSAGSLDMAKAQTEIAKGIEEQTGATGVTVTCPESVPIEQGATFNCTANTAAGESATITATQTDDQGNITWKITEVAASESPSP